MYQTRLSKTGSGLITLKNKADLEERFQKKDLKVNKFDVLVDRHKKVFIFVNSRDFVY
jgi:hypothetical protein